MAMHQRNTSPLQDPAFLEMMGLFDGKNYWQRLRMMFAGLGRERDSREFKIARIELQRQAAPLMAVLLPAVCILLLALLSSSGIDSSSIIETSYIDPVDPGVLDKFIQREPMPDDFRRTDIDFTHEFAMTVTPPVPTPGVSGPVNAPPTTFDSIPTFRSPKILRTIISGPRGPAGREKGIAAGSGNRATETAVMRALRWLKSRQNADGSWPGNKNAMTALALLCYLAHGEIPGDSPEFGETVRLGIEYLLASQPSSGQWPGNYEHYIATYALCEAYGMTMNPNIKPAAERAVKLIVDGQHLTGGWDYGLKPGDRDDTSVMGWAAQALKAAKMADFYSDPEALDRACKLAVKGFQRNAHADGGFGYTGPGRGGLTSVGALCMQFHDAGNYPEVRKALELMDTWVPAWNGSRPGARLDKDAKRPEIAGIAPGGSTQYYYYYATQAMFQSGGSRWEKWNEGMWPEYVKAQFVEEKKIADADGVMQDIGWWENSDAHTIRPVMDTCLAALQLMVYYRYLPTFQSVSIPPEIVATAQEPADVKVNVSL